MACVRVRSVAAPGQAVIGVCEAPGCARSAVYAAFPLWPDDAPAVLLCEEHGPTFDDAPDYTVRGVG